jgi:hypothetical protein
MNGPPKYSYDQLREEVNKELLSKDMSSHLYKSTDAIFRIVDAIVKTEGNNWAAQVLDNEGKPMLTPEEQKKFTEAFQPYVESIIDFFDNPKVRGGEIKPYIPNVEKLSGMSKNFLKKKASEVTGVVNDPTKMMGPDDLYAKIIQKIGSIDSTVNDYASKYGILRLEEEHDLEPDPRIIPEPAAIAISEGIFALSSAAGFPISPAVTKEVLSKIKIPFRTIVFVIFLALDVARITMAVTDRPTARKVLSVILSILELLKGDWKKSILTFVGFYGMTPLLAGTIMKAFLTLFRRLSPQLQFYITYGTLDITKSLMIGTLLSIFQVTAPEEVRLPMIEVLEKIAKRKAEMDGELVDQGLSARPDYLSPTFEDLNNIQAVMSDTAYICSCEFEELIKVVDKSAVIKIILQILRVPVTEEYRKYICGDGPCKPFVNLVVDQSIKDKQRQEELSKPTTLELPIQLNPDDILTKPVQAAKEKIQETAKGVSNATQSAVTEAITSVLPGLKPENKEEDPESENKEEEPAALEENNNPKPVRGGRILHSRLNKKFIA